MVELEFYWDGFSYFEDEEENCEIQPIDFVLLNPETVLAILSKAPS